MAEILDWVNVMTDDFHSGGTRTGFNSALYNDDPSNSRLKPPVLPRGGKPEACPGTQHYAGC